VIYISYLIEGSTARTLVLLSAALDACPGHYSAEGGIVLLNDRLPVSDVS